MHKDKLKSLDIRFYLIPFFILILVFVVFTVLNVNYNIEKSFGNFEEDARSIADSYTQNLLNSNEAHEIISELLNEKLSVASQALILIDDIKNSETLSTLADQFQLDEIHLYNTEGEIIYSKGQKYLGWKAYKGHPVYEFMISDKTQMVEAIRKDSESEVYYKYAYVKSENGYLVQIGVLAEKVNAFLQEFEMQKLIMDIATRSNAIQVSFIDTYGQVVASSTNEHGVLKRQKNMYHAERIMVANMSAFEVSVPVFYSDDMVGTLSIAWPTAEIDEEVKEIGRASWWERV